MTDFKIFLNLLWLFNKITDFEIFLNLLWLFLKISFSFIIFSDFLWPFIHSGVLGVLHYFVTSLWVVMSNFEMFWNILWLFINISHFLIWFSISWLFTAMASQKPITKNLSQNSVANLCYSDDILNWKKISEIIILCTRNKYDFLVLKIFKGSEVLDSKNGRDCCEKSLKFCQNVRTFRLFQLKKSQCKKLKLLKFFSKCKNNFFNSNFD